MRWQWLAVGLQWPCEVLMPVICVMTFFIKCNKIPYYLRNIGSSHFNADPECFLLKCWQILVTKNLMQAAWTHINTVAIGSWQHVQHPVWGNGIPWCTFFCLCAVIFRNVTSMINDELMYNKNYIICTQMNAFHVNPQHRKLLTYWLLCFKGVCVSQKMGQFNSI